MRSRRSFDSLVVLVIVPVLVPAVIAVSAPVIVLALTVLDGAEVHVHPVLIVGNNTIFNAPSGR